MTGYEKSVEKKMRRLFKTLSEKDRRRYAGIKAAKLGHGGIEYVCGLFGIDPKIGAARHGRTRAGGRRVGGRGSKKGAEAGP